MGSIFPEYVKGIIFMGTRLAKPALRIVAGLALMGCAACSGSPHTLVGSPDEAMPSNVIRAAATSGDAAMAAGQPGAAAGLYERAYKARPSPEVAVRWARALRLSGDPQSGYLALKDAVAKYPRNVAVLTELGRCASAGGYRDEAMDAFSKAVAGSGAGWDTFMADGAFEAVRGSPATAQAMFSRALGVAATDRERYDALANMAFLKAQNGDVSGGVADMQAIVAHPGVDAKVHADMALLYSMSGDRAGYQREIIQAGLPPGDAGRINAWLDGTESTPDLRASPAAAARRYSAARRANHAAAARNVPPASRAPGSATVPPDRAVPY